ncbi:hypothetical protein JD844_015560 [Phrynosoma platyrhinos]|uniref:Uncharacterized protein n=1 Tax=Phrynosoma platyrhinos TaxID=52577 RepID=A0ABQ7SJI1_PHRPL|nr:hypothetical protein JD844_015560 [Phrynosoma platyrhinos]
MESSKPSDNTSKSKPHIPFQVHPRADAIRSKLIYTFYLIDHLRGLSHAVPRHNIRDFLDPKKRKKLMLTDHHQLVRFNVMPIRNVMVTQEKRWRNRIEEMLPTSAVEIFLALLNFNKEEMFVFEKQHLNASVSTNNVKRYQS